MYRTVAKLITWRTLFFGNMSQVALFINRSRGVSYSGQYLLPHSPQKVIQRCTYRAFLEVFCNKCLWLSKSDLFIGTRT